MYVCKLLGPHLHEALSLIPITKITSVYPYELVGFLSIIFIHPAGKLFWFCNSSSFTRVLCPFGTVTS